MTITSKLVRLAASASLVALSAATVASAQPLANPLIPASTRGAEKVATGNSLRPRIGVQAAYTDNVASVSTNEQSDVLGRISAGLDGRYDSPRATVVVSGDVVYDFYSKNKKFDTLSFNGVGTASYIVVPQILAIEAGGAQTQGSATTFGTTDFYRSANANDYQIGTYYIGPHLTLAPGIFDVSAAARYGQLFYDSPNSPTIDGLASDTSFYQLIGAADTKNRLGRLRLITSGQYQADDQEFESTAGSVSAFYQATVRFTGILRVGYDDAHLTDTLDLKSPFWSVGGQYILGETSYLRFEGGQRYKKPYASAEAEIQASRTVNLSAEYEITQSPGAIAVNNVLVDYVGGLNDPLPIAAPPPSFGLNTTYYDEPSLNRNASVRVFVDLDRTTINLVVSSTQQKVQTNTNTYKTISEEATYAYQVRPDLSLSAQFSHASGNGNRMAVGTEVDGHYYQFGAKADYGLNSRTRLTGMYQNRRFRADGSVTTSDFDENIASIALIRQF